MPISIFALVMGILLTCVGGYFSVVGLATIFSGAYWSVVVMAGTLELSKVVAASWIYRCWSIAPILMRVYMVTAVIILVGITSMGIFGFLSKAHLETTISQGGNNEIKIETIESKIDKQEAIINDGRLVLSQLDDAVSILQKYDRIRGPEGSLAVRANQQEERSMVNDTITAAYLQIEQLQEELLPLQKQKISFEAEIGPIKYIAEMIYGKENASLLLDDAVRWVILILVVVFDPLAIVLIIAGNIGISNKQKQVQFFTQEEIMKDVDLHYNASTDGHGLGG